MTKEKKQFDFMKHKKVFLTTSIILIVLSILCSFFGVDFAIEFKGGTIISYAYTGEINPEDAQSKIEEIADSSVTITQGELFNDERKSITISFVSDEGLTSDIQMEITNTLQEIYPDNNLEILDSSDVTPSAGRSFMMKCIAAVIFASIVLIIYITIRFRKIGGLSAGVCAVIAIFHDIILTYGAFILLGFEINANFIAVILTMLGYSINDTIVIYDRIRENRDIYPKENLSDLVNKSINQSLQRSIRTSLTTMTAMATVSIVCSIYGITSILSFSLPLLIGMIIGTYSSICIASPLWVIWNEHKKKKELKNA